MSPIITAEIDRHTVETAYEKYLRLLADPNPLVAAEAHEITAEYLRETFAGYMGQAS